jgi:TRAP-type mannitol/chloroaromatic compound transport system substrate-binding protein
MSFSMGARQHWPGFTRAPGERARLGRAAEAVPQLLEAATVETNACSLSRYDLLNMPALRRLVAAGTQPRGHPREVLTASHEAKQQTFTVIDKGSIVWRGGMEQFHADPTVQSRYLQV